MPDSCFCAVRHNAAVLFITHARSAAQLVAVDCRNRATADALVGELRKAAQRAIAFSREQARPRATVSLCHSSHVHRTAADELLAIEHRDRAVVEANVAEI